MDNLTGLVHVMGRGLKGFSDVFNGSKDTVWCQHCPCYQWWQECRIMLSLAPVWWRNSMNSSGLRLQNTMQVAPSQPSFQVAPQLFESCLGNSSAPRGMHSPWPLLGHLQMWSGPFLLCNVELISEGAHMDSQSPYWLSGQVNMPGLFCCSLTRKSRWKVILFLHIKSKSQWFLNSSGF